MLCFPRVWHKKLINFDYGSISGRGRKADRLAGWGRSGQMLPIFGSIQGVEAATTCCTKHRAMRPLHTRAFELLVVQVRHVLALQLRWRLAAGVGRQAGGAAEEPGQPGQMAVAGERIVRQSECPQTSQSAEDVVRQGCQVVVVQRAAKYEWMVSGWSR